MTDDFWKPLGEARWRELVTAKASELQLKFAVARFSGASATAAAKIAGYSGNAEELRRAGYSAAKSTAVTNLLELAAINAPEQSELTDKEVDAKIAKLVRSADPNVSMKAAELYDKRKQRAKDAGETPDDDGLSDWRLVRSFLEMQNGASQFMLFYKALAGDMGHPANYPLLHDVYSLMQREPFGQQIFDWCGANLSETMRQALQEKLADASYQLEMRRQIWSEVNKRPPGPIDARAA